MLSLMSFLINLICHGFGGLDKGSTRHEFKASLLTCSHAMVFFFLMNVSSYFFFSLRSFGLAPAGPLQVLTPLNPNQSVEVTLPLSTVGPVMKMDPLTNLQVLTNFLVFFNDGNGKSFFPFTILTVPSNSWVVRRPKLKDETAFRMAVINSQ